MGKSYLSIVFQINKQTLWKRETPCISIQPTLPLLHLLKSSYYSKVKKKYFLFAAGCRYSGAFWHGPRQRDHHKGNNQMHWRGFSGSSRAHHGPAHRHQVHGGGGQVLGVTSRHLWQWAAEVPRSCLHARRPPRRPWARGTQRKWGCQKYAGQLAWQTERTRQGWQPFVFFSLHSPILLLFILFRLFYFHPYHSFFWRIWWFLTSERRCC